MADMLAVRPVIVARHKRRIDSYLADAIILAMCNNYKMRKAAAEVARMFQVELPNIAPFNAAEDIYPGYPGMVVRPTEQGRVLEAMTWGFPHRPKNMKPTSKPLKVNNARDDQLLNSWGLWKDSFERRRCLIPVTAWAEAEGEPGSKTKTWYSLPDTELFAVAGIWRPTRRLLHGDGRRVRADGRGPRPHAGDPAVGPV